MSSASANRSMKDYAYTTTPPMFLTIATNGGSETVFRPPHMGPTSDRQQYMRTGIDRGHVRGSMVGGAMIGGVHSHPNADEGFLEGGEMGQNIVGRNAKAAVNHHHHHHHDDPNSSGHTRPHQMQRSSSSANRAGSASNTTATAGNHHRNHRGGSSPSLSTIHAQSPPPRGVVVEGAAATASSSSYSDHHHQSAALLPDAALAAEPNLSNNDDEVVDRMAVRNAAINALRKLNCHHPNSAGGGAGEEDDIDGDDDDIVTAADGFSPAASPRTGGNIGRRSTSSGAHHHHHHQPSINSVGINKTSSNPYTSPYRISLIDRANQLSQQVRDAKATAAQFYEQRMAEEAAAAEATRRLERETWLGKGGKAPTTPRPFSSSVYKQTATHSATAAMREEERVEERAKALRSRTPLRPPTTAAAAAFVSSSSTAAAAASTTTPRRAASAVRKAPQPSSVSTSSPSPAMAAGGGRSAPTPFSRSGTGAALPTATAVLSPPLPNNSTASFTADEEDSLARLTRLKAEAAGSSSSLDGIVDARRIAIRNAATEQHEAVIGANLKRRQQQLGHSPSSVAAVGVGAPSSLASNGTQRNVTPRRSAAAALVLHTTSAAAASTAASKRQSAGPPPTTTSGPPPTTRNGINSRDKYLSPSLGLLLRAVCGNAPLTDGDSACAPQPSSSMLRLLPWASMAEALFIMASIHGGRTTTTAMDESAEDQQHSSSLVASGEKADYDSAASVMRMSDLSLPALRRLFLDGDWHVDKGRADAIFRRSTSPSRGFSVATNDSAMTANNNNNLLSGDAAVEGGEDVAEEDGTPIPSRPRSPFRVPMEHTRALATQLLCAYMGRERQLFRLLAKKHQHGVVDYIIAEANAESYAVMRKREERERERSNNSINMSAAAAAAKRKEAAEAERRASLGLSPLPPSSSTASSSLSAAAAAVASAPFFAADRALPSDPSDELHVIDVVCGVMLSAERYGRLLERLLAARAARDAKAAAQQAAALEQKAEENGEDFLTGDGEEEVVDDRLERLRSLLGNDAVGGAQTAEVGGIQPESTQQQYQQRRIRRAHSSSGALSSSPQYSRSSRLAGASQPTASMLTNAYKTASSATTAHHHRGRAPSASASASPSSMALIAHNTSTTSGVGNGRASSVTSRGGGRGLIGTTPAVRETISSQLRARTPPMRAGVAVGVGASPMSTSYASLGGGGGSAVRPSIYSSSPSTQATTGRGSRMDSAALLTHTAPTTSAAAAVAAAAALESLNATAAVAPHFVGGGGGHINTPSCMVGAAPHSQKAYHFQLPTPIPAVLPTAEELGLVTTLRLNTTAQSSSNSGGGSGKSSVLVKTIVPMSSTRLLAERFGGLVAAQRREAEAKGGANDDAGRRQEYAVADDYADAAAEEGCEGHDDGYDGAAAGGLLADGYEYYYVGGGLLGEEQQNQNKSQQQQQQQQQQQYLRKSTSPEVEAMLEVGYASDDHDDAAVAYGAAGHSVHGYDDAGSEQHAGDDVDVDGAIDVVIVEEACHVVVEGSIDPERWGAQHHAHHHHEADGDEEGAAANGSPAASAETEAPLPEQEESPFITSHGRFTEEW